MFSGSSDLEKALRPYRECQGEENIAPAIDSITDMITKDLKKGGRTTLTGFGTFCVANRKARTGRNPQTAQEIRIPARKTPKFTVGKALKEAVRQQCPFPELTAEATQERL